MKKEEIEIFILFLLFKTLIMKKIFSILLLVTVCLIQAQAYKGKGDYKFQIGANIQNGGSGIQLSSDYG